MSECCQGKQTCEHQRDFWNWWKAKEHTFTPDQVQDLVERIKKFNAGAIDEYLNKHVDKVLEEWSNENCK